MRPKNIAVLTTALDSDAQAETLKGIEHQAKKHGYNVAVFVWFTGVFEKEKHNYGEVNIVDLPDLNLFDGVIVFANALHIETNRKKIEELLSDVTCPVVGIGCKVGNSYSVNSDNYAAMRKVVEHIVEEHGMRRIHFVKGVEGNPDAQARFQAYVDVLREHDIPIVQERISQGDFYVTGAELAAQEILSSSLPFPEAIVCANDTMALTISNIMQEKGYRIPQDVIITGYDYSLEVQEHYPRITTVKSRFFELGKTACNVIVEKEEGKEVVKDMFLPDEMIVGDCCNHGHQQPKEDNVNHFFKYDAVTQRQMIHQMILLQKDIMAGAGVDDWLNALKQFITQINPQEFYCCVNEDFVENVFEYDVLEQEGVGLEEKLAYSPDVKVLLAYQNGRFKNKQFFESRYALDDLFQESEKKKLYIFSPIHYLDRNFGYFVFADSDFPLVNPLYISWLMDMGHSIENIRKQNLLQNAMKQLDEMYIRDSLTGAYNRFGMDRYFGEIKKRCMMSRVSMQLSFVDLDGLKQINDRYGHEEGDRIIRATAQVLQKKAGKYYVIRYGGDEFIVMGTISRACEVENYWKSVQQEVDEYNKNTAKPAQMALSYGYEVFKVTAETSLEECIRIADNKMYHNKHNSSPNR
ncbi:MAG: GGDEF domain-containing protein [Lachnospiraceae bacterium]|nr:GGDEF domain-containing protein [Lachnospiraceae bacterium]